MKRFLTLILLVTLSLQANAQRTVSGTLKSPSGEPVVGAVVMLKGDTKVAAVTDGEGRYTLSIPSGTARLPYKSSSVPARLAAGRA